MTDTKRKPGRPKKLPDGSKRTTILLSPEQVAKAKRLGGTVTEGVRKALDDHGDCPSGCYPGMSEMG